MTEGPSGGTTRRPKIRKIIFDKEYWHPLDHRIGSPRCLSFQGGWKSLKLHWEYEWDFGPWKDRFNWWHRLTQCRAGKHKYMTWHKRQGYDAWRSYRQCWYCQQHDPTFNQGQLDEDG